jgi:flagellar biogenesis protein FliO
LQAADRLPSPSRREAGGEGSTGTDPVRRRGLDLILFLIPLLSGAGLVWFLHQRRRRPGEVLPGTIQIVAARLLGKGQRLLLVDVDKRRFLLSTSEQAGVRLLSSIGPGEIAEAEAGDPAMDRVFADMLAHVEEPKPDREPAAAAPVQAAPPPPPPPPPARRPVLQLVEELPEPGPAPEPATARRSPEPDAGRRSPDLEGLLALRRSRQGGGR